MFNIFYITINNANLFKNNGHYYTSYTPNKGNNFSYIFLNFRQKFISKYRI